MFTEQMQQTARRRIAQYNSEVAAIKNDRRLAEGESGKIGAIASAVRRAQRDLDAMNAQWNENAGDRTATLRRQLFGYIGSSGSSDIIARRDAAERAAEITSVDVARKMLVQAENIGDTSMAKAVFQRIWELKNTPLTGDRWVALVNDYLADHPMIASAAQELSEIERPMTSMDRFTAEEFTRVPVPSELRMPGRHIDALADAYERGDDAVPGGTSGASNGSGNGSGGSSGAFDFGTAFRDMYR